MQPTLQDLMRRRGLRQADLPLTQGTVSRLATGQSQGRATTLRALATALGCSIEEICQAIDASRAVATEARAARAARLAARPAQ